MKNLTLSRNKVHILYLLDKFGDDLVTSVAKVAEALKGIDFPANKRECIDYAKRHQASDDVLRVMEKMPEQKYESMADIFKAVGQVEPVHQGKPF